MTKRLLKLQKRKAKRKLKNQLKRKFYSVVMIQKKLLSNWNGKPRKEKELLRKKQRKKREKLNLKLKEQMIS